MTRLYTDAALEADETHKDELQVMPFVRRLLRPILEWPAEEGFVVGLYAPWGYGKTTVLNFLAGELDKLQPSGRRAIVVKFNPWLYGTPEAMLASFFGTVANAVKQVRWLPAERERLNALADALQGVGTLIPVAAASVGMPGVAPFVGLAASGLARLAKKGETDLRERQDVAKKSLRALGARKARLVVLIDDVDRAERAEILALLKLVKLIGGLPNTTYVLAMDDARVRQMLDGHYAAETGAAYLEKIVQTPVHLPLIAPDRLQQLVRSALEEIAASVGIPATKLFPTADWNIRDIYSDTIARRVGTLRDRARLVNAFRFFLASSDDLRDINPEDALLLVFLQTFYPGVYEAVRTNKMFLTAEEEQVRHLLDGANVDRSRRRRESTWYRIITGEMPDETLLTVNDEVSKVLADNVALSPADAALRRMFPFALTGFTPGEGQQRELRAEHSICIFGEFDRYFQLKPPPGEIPDVVAEALIEGLVDVLGGDDWEARRSEAVGLFGVLHRYDSPEYRESLVDKIHDRVGRVPSDLLPRLGTVILDVQKELPTQATLRLLALAVAYVCQQRLAGGHDDAAFEDQAASVVSLMAAEIVKRIGDPIQAAAFAVDMVNETRGWGLPENARLAIAREVRDRLLEYLRVGGNPFEAEPLAFLPLISFWMKVEQLVGDDGRDRRQLFDRFLSAKPERVRFYVHVYSTHTETGPTAFAPGERREAVLDYHDKVVGLPELRNLLASFLESGIDDPLDIVAQAAAYFAAREEDEARQTPADP